MTLNYVELTLDLYDGSGSYISQGTATFKPSVTLTDATDSEYIPQAPVTGSFKASGSPKVKLLGTDNSNVTPAGWGWTVTFSGVPGNPAGFSFFLAYSNGASQNLSALAPASGELPVTITSLDGGSAATGVFPVGALDGGNA